MNYVFRNYDYKEVHDELIDEQSSWLEKIDFYKLNDEVEKIEEDKKIKKLDLDKEESLKAVIKTAQDYVLANKINEIIDYLEENK